MRSGRGKCPQCKEMIVVDLDAQEIRCPYCNALLKKSKKTPADVRAENEAREAAAREQAAAEAAAAQLAAQEAEAVAEQPVAEEAAAVAAPEVPAQEAAPEVAEESPAQEAAPEAAEESPAQEAAEEPVDEIGISDEELAAMDEAPVAEEAQEQTDEIGISDEELAAMDEAPQDEGAEDPEVVQSISAEEEDVLPEESEEEDSEEPQEEEEIGGGEIDIAPDDVAPDDENVVDEAVSEETVAAEAVSEEANAEDVIPADQTEEEVISAEQEPAVEEEKQAAPAFGAPMPEEEKEDVPEEIPEQTAEEDAFDLPEAIADEFDDEAEANALKQATEEVGKDDAFFAEPEEVAVVSEEEDAPVVSVAEAEEEVPVFTDSANQTVKEEETPAFVNTEEAETVVSEVKAFDVGEPEPAKDAYVPTEEDMAFAASLEAGNTTTQNAKPVGFRNNNTRTERSKSLPKSKGGKKMDSESMFKKPIAIVMSVLALLATAFYFLYYRVGALAVFSESFCLKVADAMPKLDAKYQAMIFWGAIALISVLAATSRKFCPAAIFMFLVAACEMFLHMLPYFLEDNAKFLEFYADYWEYVEYAMYGLLFLALIFVGIAVNSADYRGSRATSVLPAIYMVIALAAYALLTIYSLYLTKVKAFDFVPEYDKYFIMGVWGIAVLLTLVGVHDGKQSRNANGWIFFMGLLLAVLSFGVQKGLDIFNKEYVRITIDSYPFFTPVIPLVGFLGYTVADLRN